MYKKKETYTKKKRMKSKKQLIVGIIIALMLLIPTISKANMEMKPGTTVWTGITVSDAYDACRGLDVVGSALGTDKLDPHLALNKDWGAVAYLAVSSIGNVGTSNLPTVTIGENSYTTTTGNLTGVMNFGKTNTYTSSGLSTVIGTAKNPGWRQSLIDNKDTRYVELLPGTADVKNTRGMAIKETEEWFSSKVDYPVYDEPLMLRDGVLGFFNGDYGVLYQRHFLQRNLPSGPLEYIRLIQ